MYGDFSPNLIFKELQAKVLSHSLPINALIIFKYSSGFIFALNVRAQGRRPCSEWLGILSAMPRPGFPERSLNECHGFQMASSVDHERM